MPDKYLFLLGGYDLEMVEIRNILIQQHFSFFDKKLSWGAKLSEYKDELQHIDDDIRVVGIELIEDIQLPNNYLRIDHHNELSHLPSSIEQIAELLGIELNRYQKLVAANDSGYIDKMLELCAGYNEAMEIRLKDKKIQGVTEKDEELAEKSIKNKNYKRDVVVIESLTERFSAICDKLYPVEKLLVYMENKLTYYGKNVKILVEHYKDLIKDQKAYSGGGENGFFGIAENVMNKEEIEMIKNKIIELAGEEKKMIQSYHIFMFPFRWDFKSRDQAIDEIEFKERTDFDKIVDYFEGKELNGSWDRNRFDFNSPQQFNTSAYFYEFANDAIFDEVKELNPTHDKDRIVISYKLRIDKKQKNEYKIYLLNKEQPYILNIDQILLNVYNTGVAILAYHLENFDYNHQDDILNINDYGRRIYPQFLGKADFVLSTKKSFLADRIQMEIFLENSTQINTNEVFCHYTSMNSIKEEGAFILPDHVKALLGNKFRSTNNIDVNFFRIKWLIDDRMFVLCWYGNDFLARKLCASKQNKCNGAYEYNFQDNPLWHEFIFVDHSYSTCQNGNMLRKLLDEHTYERWTNYKTLFGLSRYSFIILSENNEDTREKLLLPHLRNMYYQMVQLCLAQRASILKFSEEVTRISTFKKQEEYKITKEISALSKEYLQFVNKVYFREITAQEQGIELYDKMQELMRIERDVKDLDREIDELHQFASLKEDKENNKMMSRLNWLGILFLPATLIAGVLGMNTFQSINDIPNFLISGNPIWSFWFGTLALSIFLIILNYRFLINSIKRRY